MDRTSPSAGDGGYDPAAIETHSSVVFFVGDRVYKLKKSIDLGFVDFRERAQRKAISHREVDLNRRLSPDAYMGVADVFDQSGAPCDHLVVMRRMPSERRLSTLISRGEPVEGLLNSLVEVLVQFHSQAMRSPQADEAAAADSLDRLWTINTSALLGLAGGGLDSATIETIDSLARRYLGGRRELFDSRIAAGKACDGHGDLLTDDIFFPDETPQVLDCLEFDDDLRLGDVLADVAFLAMDLERIGRGDLAQRFMTAYMHSSGDDWPPTLEHHYIAYRAQVRAKVSAIRAGQGDTGALETARGLLEISRSHLDAARVRLVIVGGSPGTGKSTLSQAMAEATGAVIIRSDEVRKDLAQIPRDQSARAPFGEGLYTPEAKATTYDEALRRAESALRMGRCAILDASWSSEIDRVKARELAGSTRSDLIELRCVAPEDLVAQRILHRSEIGIDPSDAGTEIASKISAAFVPWPQAVEVDTSVGLQAALEIATQIVGPT